MQPIGDLTMASPEPRLIPVRRRGRPRAGVFPQTRKQILDAAIREALDVAFGQSGGHLMHLDCGSLPSSHRWFVVQTHHGQERRAAAELRNQHFTTFLPVSIRDGGCEHRRRKIVRPELPRYLFTAFDPAVAPWRRIFSTYGVARLFTLGDFRPAPARVGDVEALIGLVRQQIGEVAPEPAARVVRPGDRGQVVEGPLAGFSCVAEVVLPDGRVRVDFQLFGRSSPVELEPGAIRWG